MSMLSPTPLWSRLATAASTATAVKAFLTSATDNGQTGLDTRGYIPIPDLFKTKLGTAINAIS